MTKVGSVEYDVKINASDLDKNKKVNLFDLIKDKRFVERIKERYKKRVESKFSDDNKVDISPEVYILSEFGYFYGWGAVEAALNNEITLEAALALVDGAKKVHYTRLIDDAHAQVVAIQSAHADKPSEAFSQGMKPFTERAK